jgi:hypothetical protein
MRLAHQTLGATAIFLALTAAVTPACKGRKAAELPSADANKLIVVKALWGDLLDDQTSDVTKIVAGMVKDNALRVNAVAQVLGDPAKVKLKQLRVDWSRGGVPGRKRVLEGETLTIGADEKPVPVRLVVRKAVYGNFTSGKTTDVTKQVADMVKDNALGVTPTNALFGDPAQGQTKELRLDYTFDGVAKSKSTAERQPLIISDSGQ